MEEDRFRRQTNPFSENYFERYEKLSERFEEKVNELKKNRDKFELMKTEKMFLSTTNNKYIEFIVNFFAGVFSHKNLYLITDKNRIKELNFEYILPQEIAQTKAKNISFLLFSFTFNLIIVA